MEEFYAPLNVSPGVPQNAVIPSLNQGPLTKCPNNLPQIHHSQGITDPPPILLNVFKPVTKDSHHTLQNNTGGAPCAPSEWPGPATI